jgi:hypothetical protein
LYSFSASLGHVEHCSRIERRAAAIVGKRCLLFFSRAPVRSPPQHYVPKQHVSLLKIEPNAAPTPDVKPSPVPSQPFAAAAPTMDALFTSQACPGDRVHLMYEDQGVAVAVTATVAFVIDPLRVILRRDNDASSLVEFPLTQPGQRTISLTKLGAGDDAAALFHSNAFAIEDPATWSPYLGDAASAAVLLRAIRAHFNIAEPEDVDAGGGDAAAAAAPAQRGCHYEMQRIFVLLTDWVCHAVAAGANAERVVKEEGADDDVLILDGPGGAPQPQSMSHFAAMAHHLVGHMKTVKVFGEAARAGGRRRRRRGGGGAATVAVVPGSGTRLRPGRRRAGRAVQERRARAVAAESAGRAGKKKRVVRR